MRPFTGRTRRWVSRFLSVLPLLVAAPDPVEAAGACGQLVLDDFEAGELSASPWDTRSGELPERGRLHVSRYAAIEGRFGMAADFSADAPARAQSPAPAAEALHRVRVLFDPNGFVPDAGETLTILALVERRAAGDGTVRKVASIALGRSEDALIVYARGLQDTGPRLATSAAVISDAPHLLELEWAQSGSPAGADGQVALWVDGVLVGAVTDLRNGSLGVEAVRVGAIGPIRAGAGRIFFDDFRWEVGRRAGRYLYVAGGNAVMGAVAGYSIDCVSGALAPVPGSPFVAPQQADAVAIDPAGRHLHASSLVFDSLASYRIDQDTGSLVSHIPPTQTTESPGSIAFHPSGRSAYVSNWGSNSISHFAADPATGRLQSVGATGAGFAPNGLAVHPAGRVLYAAIQGAGSVSAYHIEADGSLVAMGSVPAGDDTIDLATDRYGRFLYAANYTPTGLGPGSVSGYRIDSDTGQLTAVPGSPLVVGERPQGVAVHPSGRWVYVVDGYPLAARTLTAYAVEPTSGALSAVPGTQGSATVGILAVQVAVDPSGLYLYVATQTGTLHVFAVDPATGALEQRPPVALPNALGNVLTILK